MKKLYAIVCIAAFVGTLLTASNAFCGTDDSGLQVFEIDAAKMNGMTADIFSEDTVFGMNCKNLYKSMNGLSTLHYQADADIFTWGSTTAVSLLRFIDFTKTRTHILNLFYKDGSYYVTRAADNVPVISGAEANNSFIFGFTFFNSSFYEYVLTQKVCRNVNTLAAVTMPWTTAGQDAYTAALWQNRLFVLTGGTGTTQKYTLWWSAPGNYTDFTTTATTGGVINIADFPSITKIIGTKYGLYLIALEGIWMVSGGSSPSAWTVQKIADFPNEASYGGICEYKDQVFIACDKGLFLLAGTQLQQLSTLPEKINISSTSVYQDRFVAVTVSPDLTINPTYSYSTGTSEVYLYDTQNKSWSTLSTLGGLFMNNYWVKFTSNNLGFTVYEAPPLTYEGANTKTFLPFNYATNWMTLDGNGANSKKIHRIEIECGGNAQTIEVSMLAERADNTALGNAYSYIDFVPVIPITPVSFKSTRPPTNTFVWNVFQNQPFRKIALNILSLANSTITGHFVIKKIRVYYFNLGNPLKNTLR